SKVKEILAILNGESPGEHLPIVKLGPDPKTPGGFVLIDQTHTYAAYKQLGFEEIPAHIYNETDGLEYLISQQAYKTERYASIDQLLTVKEFSGSPSEIAAKRRTALEGVIQ